MSEPEKLLPKAVLDKARISSGMDYWWLHRDVEEVINVAKDINLVSIGWDTEFLYESLCNEAWCWLSFRLSPRGRNESWPDFVNRSAHECIEAIHRVMSGSDFINEGMKAFGINGPSYAALTARYDDPLLEPKDHLWFMLRLLEMSEQP